MTGNEWNILDAEAIQKAQEALEADRREYDEGRHYNKRREELASWLEHEAPEVRWMIKTAQEREADEMMGLIPKALLWNVYEINAMTPPGFLGHGTEKLDGKIEISAEHVEDVGAQEVARVIAGLVRIQVEHAKHVARRHSADSDPQWPSSSPFHPNARRAPLSESSLRTWLHGPQRRPDRRMRLPASLMGGACLIAGILGTGWGLGDGRVADSLLILAGVALLLFAASLRKT